MPRLRAPSRVIRLSYVNWSVPRWRLLLPLFALGIFALPLRAQTVQYVYSANTTTPGTLSGFVKNATTGALLAVSGSPFPERFMPQQVAMDPGGKFLYVLNPGMNNVSMFQIDGTTGALTEVPGSPFSTVFSAGGGTNPQAIAIGGGGKYVFVGNATSASISNDGCIDIFSVDGVSHALVPISSVDTKSQIAGLVNDPKGTNLYALLGPNPLQGDTAAYLTAYSIDPGSGLLLPNPPANPTVSAGDTGHSLAMDAQGRWLFAGSGEASGQVISFPISPLDGSLQASSQLSFLLGPGNFPVAMAEDGSGQFLYVSAGNAIRILSVDPTTGGLKETSVSPMQLSAAATLLAADPQGPFLYAVAGGGLRGFQIVDTTTGALQEIADSPFAPANSTAGLVIEQTPGQNISGPFAEFVPNSLSLGNWTVGTPSNTTAMQVVNTGGQTLNINSILITGPNAADFSQSNTCQLPLASSANCSVSVTFTPSAAGIRSAALSFNDNAPGSPQTVPLTGTGVAPQPDVTLTPGSLTFPVTVTNQLSPAQPVQVKNSGTGALNVANISVTGTNAGDFTQTNSCSTVAVGASCNINVTFAPKAAGSRNASLAIQDDAAGSPQTVALAGTGSDPFSLQPNGTNPTSVTINAGQTAQYNLQASPAAGFSGTITLSCAGAPTAAACQLSTTTLQLGGVNPAPLTVSVTTTARSAAVPPAAPISLPFTGRLLPLYFLLFLVILWRVMSRFSKEPALAPGLQWAKLVAFVILLATLTAAAGCGGGVSSTVPPPPPPPVGTPPGTYTITATGTAGNFSGKIDLTLIVK
jgi:6-phosphogluconolactonase (cycloisomerase 2 family)